MSRLPALLCAFALTACMTACTSVAQQRQAWENARAECRRQVEAKQYATVEAACQSAMTRAAESGMEDRLFSSQVDVLAAAALFRTAPGARYRLQEALETQAPDARELGPLHDTLGWALLVDRAYAEAETAFEQADEIYDKTGAPPQRRIAVLAGLSDARLAQKQYDDALLPLDTAMMLASGAPADETKILQRQLEAGYQLLADRGQPAERRAAIAARRWTWLEQAVSHHLATHTVVQEHRSRMACIMPNGIAPYPRRGPQSGGMAYAQVRVDALGAVDAAAIARSSGDAGVDRRGLALVRRMQCQMPPNTEALQFLVPVRVEAPQ
jgi:TonB family protein